MYEVVDLDGAHRNDDELDCSLGASESGAFGRTDDV